MNLREAWYILISAASLAALAMTLQPKDLEAGQVRTIYLNDQRPGVVTLAFDQSTALVFPSKPERAVPGSPSKLQVDFIGNELNITPRALSPGNLHVYTPSGRYVILFRMGSATNYDDIVRIEHGGPSRMARPLRLLDDSISVRDLHIEFKSLRESLESFSKTIPVSASTNRLRIEGEELFDALASLKPLRCRGCVVRFESGNLRITCRTKIKKLQCVSDAGRLMLERRLD